MRSIRGGTLGWNIEIKYSTPTNQFDWSVSRAYVINIYTLSGEWVVRRYPIIWIFGVFGVLEFKISPELAFGLWHTLIPRYMPLSWGVSSLLVSQLCIYAYLHWSSFYTA